MKLNHIISAKQFDVRILDRLFRLAAKIERVDRKSQPQDLLKGKILAALFYEPSTRTRFSFESAMLKLGGSCISTENASLFSSVSKGETLQDTIKIISGYSDVIVIRHPEKGTAKEASEISSVPIINAGDGTREHPTQALLDLYTIKKELGKIDNLKIALVGDLLYGRTIHSLIYLLALYKVKIYFVSPPQLKLPKEYKDYLRQRSIALEELSDLKKVLNKIDVLYMTRIQKERFRSKREYEKLKGAYVIDKKALQKLSKKAIIMHPLPRVDEISPEIDSDPRAAYFRQAKNGLYIRMALLQMLLK